MKQFRILYTVIGLQSSWFYTEANTEFGAIHNFQMEANKCSHTIVRRRTEEMDMRNLHRFDARKTSDNTNKLVCPTSQKLITQPK